MQFKVPQFIDEDPKIIGPLTFKQFIVVGIGGLISLVIYFFIPKDRLGLWMLISSIIFGLSVSLVFLKIEGIPLIIFIKKSISFFIKPRSYVWKKKSFISKDQFVRKEKKELTESIDPVIRKRNKGRLKKLWNDIEKE
jgi:hypothetical protein